MKNTVLQGGYWTIEFRPTQYQKENGEVSICAFNRKTDVMKRFPYTNEGLASACGFLMESILPSIEADRPENEDSEHKREWAAGAAYDVYRLHWMKWRTEEKLLSILSCVSEFVDDEEDDRTLDDYVEEQGFHGTLYACFGEFLDCELCDEGFMATLLGQELSQKLIGIIDSK